MSTRQLIMKLIKKTEKNKNMTKAMYNAAQKKRWNIVRGDKVQVIGRHKEKGKQGIVKQVYRKYDTLLVEGVNKKTVNVKGDRDRGIKGRQETREFPIPYSCVSLLDPVENIPTRIVRQYLEDGTKVRVSKRSGSIIPRPEILKVRRRPVRMTVTQDDTEEDHAWEMTYVKPDFSQPKPARISWFPRSGPITEVQRE